MATLPLEPLEFRTPIATLKFRNGAEMPVIVDPVWQRRLKNLWEAVGKSGSGGSGSGTADSEFMADRGSQIQGAEDAALSAIVAQVTQRVIENLEVYSAIRGIDADIEPITVPRQWSNFTLLADTAANLANYPAVAYPSAIYFETDTFLVRWSNGSGWTQSVQFDDAYGAGWNGSTKAPTQNAVYDKIESLPVLASGTYTPTHSNLTNLSATAVNGAAQYLRVGSVVWVSCQVDVDPVLAATATSFDMTLPVASNLASTFQLAGTGVCPFVVSQSAGVRGVVADDTAHVEFVSVSTVNTEMEITFGYLVV